MTVKIKKLHPDAKIPRYAHGPYDDSGLDLCAVERTVLVKDVPTLVKTGLSIELPPYYEAQIRPRSGLALKHGITVYNSPGTVDPSYRGEVGVILLWNGYKPNAQVWKKAADDLEMEDLYVITGSEEWFALEREMTRRADRYTELYSNPEATDDEWFQMSSWRAAYPSVGEGAYVVLPGDRVAQMVVARYEPVEFEETALSDTARGSGGFGSTGK